MKHQVSSRTFGRRPDQRKALMRGLATQLVEYERIKTTISKAKELRKYVEPLVTLGKRTDLHARRQAGRFLYHRKAVTKLFGELAPRFKDRSGGYTRISRLGRRRGDGAEEALIEFIPVPSDLKATKGKAKKKKASPQSPKAEKKSKKAIKAKAE